MWIFVLLAVLFFVICGVLVYKYGLTQAWGIIVTAALGIIAAAYGLWSALVGVPIQ
jgi:F0F1-type ATP synthase assembly protein I